MSQIARKNAQSTNRVLQLWDINYFDVQIDNVNRQITYDTKQIGSFEDVLSPTQNCAFGEIFKNSSFFTLHKRLLSVKLLHIMEQTLWFSHWYVSNPDTAWPLHFSMAWKNEQPEHWVQFMKDITGNLHLSCMKICKCTLGIMVQWIHSLQTQVLLPSIYLQKFWKHSFSAECLKKRM